MKVMTYQYPHSSLLSVEKDTRIIMSYLWKNERLKKLLYYNNSDTVIDGEHQIIPVDPFAQPPVPQEKAFELFRNSIKLSPKLEVEQAVRTYIFINFNNFTANDNNPAFRNNIIYFDIVCHKDNWMLKDFQLRPYKIAGELDTMFNNQKLSGIGKLLFLRAEQEVYSDEFSGISLAYAAIHGQEGEDSTNPVRTNETEDLIENFNKIFNDPNGI